MRDMKHIGVGLLAAAIFVTPLVAGPVTYTVNLPGNSPAGSSGQFTYDGTMFTNFIVDWNGNAFDLTPSANNPTLVNAGATCLAGYSGPQFGFAIMTQSGLPSSCGGLPISFYVEADLMFPPQTLSFAALYETAGNATAYSVSGYNPIPGNPPPPVIRALIGPWSVTAQSETPEPSSFKLLFLALLLITVRWLTRGRRANRWQGTN